MTCLQVAKKRRLLYIARLHPGKGQLAFLDTVDPQVEYVQEPRCLLEPAKTLNLPRCTRTGYAFAMLGWELLMP